MPSSRPSGIGVQPVVPDRRADRFRRRRGRRRDRPRGEFRGLRHPGQERVRALVDVVDTGERRAVDLAAETVVGLEHVTRRCARSSPVVGSRASYAGGEPGMPPPTTTRWPLGHGAGAASASTRRPTVSTASTTRSASAAITAGSSLTHAVRAKARPARRGAGRWPRCRGRTALRGDRRRTRSAHEHAVDVRRIAPSSSITCRMSGRSTAPACDRRTARRSPSRSHSPIRDARRRLRRWRAARRGRGRRHR